MPTPLPERALLTTFLSDILSRRRMDIDHLADLLAPIPARSVRAWIEGGASPPAEQLTPLANALGLDPVELTVGWMIDRAPEVESVVRPFSLDQLGSDFPRSTDLILRAPRIDRNFKVIDPHDERESRATRVPIEQGRLRKRASGSTVPANAACDR